jgi:YggT family protein
MRVFLHVLDLVLAVYTWLLLASAVLYCLIGFGAIDASRRARAAIGAFLSAVTTPVLRPIRRLLPQPGGIDISPVVAIVLVAAIRYVIVLYILPKLP